MWRHVALRNYGNSFGMLMFGAKKSPKRAKIIQCNTNKSERFIPLECKVNYSATLELVSPPPPPNVYAFRCQKFISCWSSSLERSTICAPGLTFDCFKRGLKGTLRRRIAYIFFGPPGKYMKYFSIAKLFLIALLRNNYLSPKCIGD